MSVDVSFQKIMDAIVEATKELEPEKRARFLWKMEDVFRDIGNLGHDLRRAVSDMRRAK